MRLQGKLVGQLTAEDIAIALGASATLLAHNHPSGDPSPSADDRAVTDSLVAAGKILEMPVHDHVIFGADATQALQRRACYEPTRQYAGQRRIHLL
jgi:hypothetical protein